MYQTAKCLVSHIDSIQLQKLELIHSSISSHVSIIQSAFGVFYSPNLTTYFGFTTDLYFVLKSIRNSESGLYLHDLNMLIAKLTIVKDAIVVSNYDIVRQVLQDFYSALADLVLIREQCFEV